MDAPRDDDGARWLEVPETPGPLRALDPARPRDEVDEALDELFGDDDRAGPGLADVALVVGGLALVAVAVVRSLGAVAVSIGLGAIVLGIALPVQALARRRRARTLARRRAGAARRGGLLRGDDPAVHDLVAAHDRVLAVAADEPEAAAVAHAAVAEVASLLAGAPAATAAQRGYVDERTTALRALADALARRPPPAARQPDTDGADALVHARRELDDALGGTVQRADDLRRRLRGDGDA